ncbi:hypothetical protein [Clostridium sardiniense]|uniref:hypothetical protein n=1 Tax=Clostridium sardiniense TaxID=29369 RepID=UPI003D33FD23
MKKRRFKIKHNGSMLLECIAAIFIITMVFILFIDMNRSDHKSFKIRNDMRVNSILLNNVINEIKFNTSIDELKDLFLDNKITIGINENIFEELKTKDILGINDIFSNKIIQVEKIKEEEDGILLDFALIENGEDIVLKEEVKKEIWMGERDLRKDIQ